jgi:hypothetical protein
MIIKFKKEKKIATKKICLNSTSNFSVKNLGLFVIFYMKYIPEAGPKNLGSDSGPSKQLPLRRLRLRNTRKPPFSVVQKFGNFFQYRYEDIDTGNLLFS